MDKKELNNIETKSKFFTIKDIVILIVIIAVTAGAGAVLAQSLREKEAKEAKEKLLSSAEEYMENEVEHSFTEATCDTPKTCKLCGITEGGTLEHEWQEATSKTPKTCKLCGLTEGDVIKPFMEENGFILSTDISYESDYIAELCDSDVTQKYEYNSIKLEKPTPAAITIDNVSVAESDDPDTNIINIQYTCDIFPKFIKDASKPKEQWKFVTSSPAFDLCDYYTGEVFDSRSTMGNDGFESSEEIIWDGTTYRIEYNDQRNITDKWLGWESVGNNTYEELLQCTVVANVEVRVPKDYDGLVLFLRKDFGTDNYDYNEDRESLEEEYNFVEMVESGENNINDEFLFIRVSDIEGKFE